MLHRMIPIVGTLCVVLALSIVITIQPVYRASTVHDEIIAAVKAHVTYSTLDNSDITTDAIDDRVIKASAIGSSELATNSITSDEIDATAVSEIQSGLATSAAVASLPTTLGNTAGPSGSSLGADHLTIDRSFTWEIDDIAGACVGGCTIISAVGGPYTGNIVVSDRLNSGAGDAAGVGCSVAGSASGLLAISAAGIPGIASFGPLTTGESITVTTGGSTICHITMHITVG